MISIKKQPNFQAGATWKNYDMGPAVPRGRIVFGDTSHRVWCIPGAVPFGARNTGGYGGLVHVFEPFSLDFPMTLEALACEVTTALPAGATVKLGITKATDNWVPTGSLLWNNNASPLALSTTGSKVISGINLDLSAGHYFKVFMFSVAMSGGIMRAVQASRPGLELGPSIVNTTPLVFVLYENFVRAYVILDPTPAPNAIGGSAFGMQHFFVMDMSVVTT